MSRPAIGQRSQVKRLPERGHYDREVIDPILDEGQIGHVGISSEYGPVVIPMLYARQDADLLMHGSVVSRLLKTLGDGVDACFSMTLLDGMVLARSTFHHSCNYRSVVAFGKAHLITEEAEKRAGLDHIVEHLVPGRSADARGPNRKELNATTLIRFEVSEASAKIRSGPPGDAKADYELDHWAGVLPVRQQYGDPVPDPDLRAGIELPDYLKRLLKPTS